MAKRLKINFDVLRETSNAYQTSINEINTALAAVDVAMGNLRGTKWSSDASAAYFLQYSDNWRKSVQNRLVALEKLKSGMDNADREYSALYNEIPRLLD